MCGATSQQKQLEQQQADFYKTMSDQAKAVFGVASAISKDLETAFEPILAKGPNQEGFSAAEKANLEDTIINSSGNAYKHAADAVNAQLASEGGGDVPIISSNSNQIRADLASSAASNESLEHEQMMEADYATGRENFMAAASALQGATGVFNPASGMANAATGAGSAAATTADQIAQENNSWVNATIGALGGVAGAALGNPSGLSNIWSGKKSG